MKPCSRYFQHRFYGLMRYGRTAPPFIYEYTLLDDSQTATLYSDQNVIAAVCKTVCSNKFIDKDVFFKVEYRNSNDTPLFDILPTLKDGDSC